MKKVFIIFVVFSILLFSQIAKKNSPTIEQKKLDSTVLSMLRQYESNSNSTHTLTAPHPESLLVEIRVIAGGDSIKKLLNSMEIFQIDKPITLGCIPCYIKPKHIRVLVDHPFIELISEIHAGKTW